ncbi:hypothetical protein [Serratia marcescens]|uniref:hypothetical protein n=1 Tax=Serratia marcescens TaxID=615 RepID=UPI00249E115F|nr:hypothetical protein [Serratia marcescens]MDI3445963.1 hypothetical protein [Serratia marcescens]
MTTIKRFTPDYKMHAVRFEAFAREAEHGELVQFDAHQQVVSAVEAERDAMAVERDAARNALASIYKTVTGELPEWSNWHAYLEDIVEEVGAAIAANQTADALAVENAAMKDVFGSGEAVVNFLSIALRHTKYDCIDLPDVALAFKMSLPETPATDAALAAIKKQAGIEAVEEAAYSLYGKGYIFDTIMDYATELREAK